MPDRIAELEAIEREVENFSASPLYAYRRENNYRPVFGKGNPYARVMLVGEAPGKQEALRGEPFVGAAGRVLDELLASINLERDQVYITNIVKDRPPENRQPQKDEIRLYAPFLRRQIAVIRPDIIVPLGRHAMEFILAEFKMPEQGSSITSLHGRPLEGQTSYGPVVILPLFHPAMAFYRRDQRAGMDSDFQVLRELIGKI